MGERKTGISQLCERRSKSCVVSFRFVSFRFVSFRFVSFRVVCVCVRVCV